MSSGAAVNETPTDLFAAGVALYGSGANLTANQNTKITLVFSSPVDWLPGSDSEKGILLHLNSSAVSYGSVGAGEVIVKVGAIYDFGTSFGVRFDSQAYNQQSSGIPEDWFEGGVDFTLVYEVAAGQVTITVNQVGVNPALVPKVLNFPESNVPGLTAVTSIGVGVGGGYKLLSIQAEGDSAATATSAPSLPAVSAVSAGRDTTGRGALGTTLPSIGASATGRDTAGERALNATLPTLFASARGGVTTKLSLPGLSAQIAGTVTGSAMAAVSLPGFSTNASAKVAGLGNAAVSLPSFSTASYAGALCSITVGGVTALAIGTTGAAGGAQITLPLFEVTATATGQNRGAANITLPSLSMGGTARAPLTLPGLALTAIGSATITATYEAYAVNLGHRKPDATDETTRYTNFPFTHVVRYQNSYYGANSTGLYLLEGTTDDGAAIPWEFKTTITDFESPMAKTVVSAYFAGRMGPEATVGIHLGESGDVSYSHSTPRGPAAQNYRQVFGLGLKARYYALSVAGEGVMELDAVEFNNKTLTRRV